MSYYIVRRDQATGTLSLALPGQFASRDYALGALSAAVASGTVDPHGDFVIADLEQGVPVLIVPGRVPHAEAPSVPVAPGAPAERPAERDDTVTPDEPPALEPGADASAPVPTRSMAAVAYRGDEPWPWSDEGLLEALIGADRERGVGL